jgi:LysM repeat protein
VSFYMRRIKIRKATSNLLKRKKTGNSSLEQAVNSLNSKMTKSSKRKFTRYGIIGGNVFLLVAIAFFVLYNRSASQTIRTSTVNSAITTANSISNPLDKLSSAQIALTTAQAVKLPEVTSIRNQADSDSLTLALTPNDSTTLAKPQIVTTGLKSRLDIITYVVKNGETVDSLSTKFGVSADSIRWSNNIGGNNLTAGIKILIPPVNGIVYVVKAGDTPTSLSQKYHSDRGQIIAFNDAEISGLRPGERIIIPNGSIAAQVLTYGVFNATYGGNGYDYGYCTWYAANRVPVPTNWGNANTWAAYAGLSGWTVSSRPVPGAVAQTSRGSEGHVAVVEAVSPDGAMMKYSDMNGLAGWGRVGYSGWVSISTFEHYIYH